MNDPHNLQRFVDAQAPVYDHVTAELRAGHKQSHWMWFIFPQIAGLGTSHMAREYALAGWDEAKAYYEHPTLGARLRECTELVLAVQNRSIHQILGAPDDMKFRSSMTLFHRVAPDDPLFARALDQYFAGVLDPLTLARLV